MSYNYESSQIEFLRKRTKYWWWVFEDAYLAILNGNFASAVVIQKLLNFSFLKLRKKWREGKRCSGWFPYTRNLFAKHFSISSYDKQKRILRSLKKLKFIEIKQKSFHNRICRWIWIDVNYIENLIQTYYAKGQKTPHSGSEGAKTTRREGAKTTRREGEKTTRNILMVKYHTVKGEEGERKFAPRPPSSNNSSLFGNNDKVGLIRHAKQEAPKIPEICIKWSKQLRHILHKQRPIVPISRSTKWPLEFKKLRNQLKEDRQRDERIGNLLNWYDKYINCQKELRLPANISGAKQFCQLFAWIEERKTKSDENEKVVEEIKNRPKPPEICFRWARDLAEAFASYPLDEASEEEQAYEFVKLRQRVVKDEETPDERIGNTLYFYKRNIDHASRYGFPDDVKTAKQFCKLFDWIEKKKRKVDPPVIGW